MPDQPDDPLNYEMKIPPEPKPDKHNGKRDETVSDDKTQKSNTDSDTSGVEKPSARRSG